MLPKPIILVVSSSWASRTQSEFEYRDPTDDDDIADDDADGDEDDFEGDEDDQDDEDEDAEAGDRWQVLQPDDLLIS